MDRHQPAYWLSRDPAEAADFLARTAVASRIVGGFVKSAQPPPGAPAPPTAPAAGGLHPDLQNALLGAGLGGLGGLGVGLMSKRKKNPLTSALTGAALGGTLGYALPAAWQGYQNLGTAPAGGTPASAAQDAQIAAKWKELGSPMQAWHKLMGTLPTLDTGTGAPGTPNAPSQAQQAKDQTSWADIGAKGVTEAAQGTGNYATNNPGAFTANAALAAAQGRYLWKTAPGQKWRDVRLGAMNTVPDPGTPAYETVAPREPYEIDPATRTPYPPGTINPATGAPYLPGTPDPTTGRPYPPGSMRPPKTVPQVDPKDMAAARVKRFVQDVEPELGRMGPLGSRMGPMQDWRWHRLNPFRRWNEGVLGSALGDLQAGGVPTNPLLAGVRGNPRLPGHLDTIRGQIGNPNAPGSGRVQLAPMIDTSGTHPTAGPGIGAGISALEHAGQTARGLPGAAGPGLGRKLGRGALYLAPHAVPHLWNALTNYWNKEPGT